MKLPVLGAESLSRLIGQASDIALLVDKKGVVLDVSVGRSVLTALGCQSWLGKPWSDTVTPESRGKVADLLSQKAPGPEVTWRHINHPVKGGEDVAIQYTSMPLDQGDMLLLGRDLEALASLQRRLVETQQSMERDYVRLRHIESRYRVLLDTSREPVLLIDAGNFKVIDSNLSAQSLLKDSNRRLVGKDVLECFEPSGWEDLRASMRMALATGRVEMCRARFLAAASEATVSLTVFRQEGGPQVLLRVFNQDAVVEGESRQTATLSQEVVQKAPWGVLLTDRHGRIEVVNDELLHMMGALSVAQVQGQLLEDWLKRGGVDWGVLSTHLRQQEQVRAFATELRAFSGLSINVEIDAVRLSDKDATFALFVRDVERLRQEETPSASLGLAGSVSGLSHLVGRMPMKDIVGETVDMIERRCIQAALTLTQNNRASAAEMLGVSRQSLYVKLRRFGMVSDDDSGE